METASPPPPHVTVFVDDRENRSGLAAAIAARGCDVAIARLDVGDVAIGDRVLVERKTISDFVASVLDRRLFDQAYALRGACARPLLVVEGSDAAEAARIEPRMLRGTLASLLVSYGIPVLRTASIEETAEWIDDFARREERRLARRFAADRPAAERTAIEMLAAIPGVGRRRASRLIEAAGPVAAVLAADERSLREIPGIGPVTARRIHAAGAAAPRSPASDAR